MRTVRIATTSFLIEETPHTIPFNLDRAEGYVRQAAERGADLVLLPETVTTLGALAWNTEMIDRTLIRSKSWLTFFSDLARDAAIAIVAPFYVTEDDALYNQATVFDRTGAVIGRYRKVQPTGLEAHSVALGSEFPVIDLGFARIGVMICMDMYFPEIARIYAMKGAEVLLWPTVAHGPTQSGLEAQLRSRAIDNSLWIVESNLAGTPPYAPYAGRFYPGNARILDFNGDTIAQTGRREGIAVADLDLDERRVTAGCFLIHEPDRTREDLESLVRMDLFAREYQTIAETQSRFYETLSRAPMVRRHRC